LGFELRGKGALLISFSGDWTLGRGLPDTEALHKEIARLGTARRIAFDAGGLKDWDSALLVTVVRIIDQARAQGMETDTAGLPGGVQGLLRLAYAVPERKGARREHAKAAWLERVGQAAIQFYRGTIELIGFVGEATLALGNMIRGRARYQRSDLLATIQDVGAQALPIVSLISVLVGMILAFVGAVQLEQFGAGIYIADLVGLGMAREMGAMMTAIIMAGRTGASFAAQIGTMQVNQEIDALRTLGISPMEFLVVPRMVALVLMMPLLTLYADLLGIVGGAIVGVGMLDLSPLEYYHQTRHAVPLHHFSAGLIKAGVFGVLVATAGCLRGMQCGRSASAVGEAATSAVVTGMVAIIVSDALLTIIYNAIGF
jgi:phospholipid/cholesterol/gamma-HCH transport system permease protein